MPCMEDSASPLSSPGQMHKSKPIGPKDHNDFGSLGSMLNDEITFSSSKQYFRQDIYFACINNTFLLFYFNSTFPQITAKEVSIETQKEKQRET